MGSANGVEIGLLFASFSAMQFLCAPFWGRLSDRYGRRPALLAVVTLVSAFGAATSMVSSFEAFLVARFLTALGAIGKVSSIPYHPP